MVPFLAALMFSLCCSQTLLCTPASVQVCSPVEGEPWKGGQKEGGGYKEVKGSHFVLSFDSLEALVGQPFLMSVMKMLEVLQCHCTLLWSTTLLQPFVTHLRGNRERGSGGEGVDLYIVGQSLKHPTSSSLLSFPFRTLPPSYPTPSPFSLPYHAPS